MFICVVLYLRLLDAKVMLRTSHLGKLSDARYEALIRPGNDLNRFSQSLTASKADRGPIVRPLPESKVSRVDKCFERTPAPPGSGSKPQADGRVKKDELVTLASGR